jgi:putative transposase
MSSGPPPRSSASADGSTGSPSEEHHGHPHSDRGGQYLSIRYTERLAEAGAVTSVGPRGDSFDNALAESTIGLSKTELIRRRGPWRGLDDLELATLEWVDWYNQRRLHGALGHVPPIEYEAAYATGDPDLTPALEGAAT